MKSNYKSIKMKYNLYKKHFSVLTTGLLFFCALNLFTSCEVDETQTVVTLTELSMQDEFDGNSLNSGVWNYDLGTGNNGWGNNELQYYTDRPDNIKVEDGMLHITARQESYMGAGYTSARINTQGKFTQQYGRFEARIQLPWGQGIWPAFWILGSNISDVGWPQCGEIDIMEYRGQAPTISVGTVHGPGYSGGQSVGKIFQLDADRFDSGFHIFGIEWGPTFINFYVDDVLYNQITPDDVDGSWVFDHDFFIIMNLAVGGGFVGPPNDKTVFPQTMLVDYVRVYQ
jgi:beta-glucanase (GH16 family)